MVLESEHMRQLAGWLAQAHLQWPLCPLCGGHDWNAYADLQTVAMLPSEPSDKFWTYTKMARIGCGQCSFSVLVPAEAIGLEIPDDKSGGTLRAESAYCRDVCEFSDMLGRW